ncbi:ABC transporter ATP-binding protein [Acidiferrimicrobium sp. IK]|uniref:ABC transporter ATP-binding protein n=1 Tax=Acidiferrimicrobium sp. IK TaxID=2871700 RepID=UPI0021CB81A3|nr:ABC transporter ATP-binding protein [Acidiferrimicrobium sp. IK]MCU4186674.1 ABC transporter ATP-binding protein [Acidiferrimicrobium sp. IK]
MTEPAQRRRRRGTAEEGADPVPGEEVLTVRDLRVAFGKGPGRKQALRGVDLSLHAGKVSGVAGESGSGKTTSALAAMGLLPAGASVEGSVRYRGTELLSLPERELRRYRGRHLAMVFQETSTALNPVIRVGTQLLMAARTHAGGSRQEALRRVTEALADVQLTDTDRVMSSYPHELSGGMCQRIIIAMALSCGSRVLFADEPTTALDVSVQAEVLSVIKGLVARRHLAVLMISHDLAVLAEVCDDLAVMYDGEIVESGAVDDVLRHPAHPYTAGLLECLPRLRGPRVELPELASTVRDADHGTGCRFRPRCPWSIERCEQAPELAALDLGSSRQARCWRSAEVLASSGAAAGSRGQR